MDEFHYYADRERGFAWQVPLLAMPQTRFLLMSATLGDTSFFEKELTRLNAKPTVTVKGPDRPVPFSLPPAAMALSTTLENPPGGTDGAPGPAASCGLREKIWGGANVAKWIHKQPWQDSKGGTGAASG